MEGELVAIWITTIFTAGGVLYTMRRNGSRGKKQDTELKTELKLAIQSITKKLDDPKNGLGAIKDSTDAQKVHCTEVSTRLCTKVEKHDSEIDALQQWVRRKL